MFAALASIAATIGTTLVQAFVFSEASRTDDKLHKSQDDKANQELQDEANNRYEKHVKAKDLASMSNSASVVKAAQKEAKKNG